MRTDTVGVLAGVATCAAAGSALSDPGSAWYRSLRKPAWQPPPVAFPVVWTTLYATIAAASAATLADLAAHPRDAAAFRRALAGNLVLNTAWSGLFFRARTLPLATVGAAALAASAADLARRAAPTGVSRALALGAYAAWCGFATVLSGTVARLNP